MHSFVVLISMSQYEIKPHSEPPEYLFSMVMDRIAEEKRRLIVKRKVAFFAAWFAVSLGASSAAVRMLWSAMAESGFITFFRLVFSDFRTVIDSWESYSYALLETMPTARLSIFLGASIVVLLSFKLLSCNIEDLETRYHKINKLNIYGL